LLPIEVNDEIDEQNQTLKLDEVERKESCESDQQSHTGKLIEVDKEENHEIEEPGKLDEVDKEKNREIDKQNQTRKLDERDEEAGRTKTPKEENQVTTRIKAFEDNAMRLLSLREQQKAVIAAEEGDKVE